MKRNILSILLACLMIVSLLVLTGCKVDDLAAQVDKNATDAENAINDAATKADADVKAAAKKAADDLAAAKEKLEKLIKDGDAADTAAISAAVKDFNAAIAAINEALNGADAALKAELAADYSEKIETATKVVEEAAAKAVAEAIEELEAAIAEGDAATAAQLSEAIAAVAGKLANLDTVVQETAITLDNLVKTELNEAIKAVADELGAETAELNALIALKADKTAVDAAATRVETLAGDLEALELVVAALADDAAAIDTMKAYVDEQIAAAKAAADVAYIVVENWNEATELIIDAVLELAEYFRSLNEDLYYEKNFNTIEDLYDAYKIRLIRAVDADAVANVIGDFKADVANVDTKVDVIYAVLTAEGKTVEEVLLNDAWNKAITEAQAKLAAETDADVVKALADVQALADEMAAKYVALIGAKVEADAINADVAAIIEMFRKDGWHFIAKDKSEAALKAIATWDAKYGSANAALIVRENVEKLNVASAEALADYAKAVEALADKLAAYNAADYVFVYTADNYKAILALNAEYEAWAADVAARGFALDGTIEAPVAAAAKTFAEGALARATALNVANAEAAAIEALVADLTDKLNNFTVVRSQYQVALEDIKAMAGAWDNTYFAVPYDAIEGVEKANYELLDHAAVAAVEELYDTVMGPIMELAEKLKVALSAIDKVTIYSGNDIEAAKAAYTAFTNKLADLGYEIEGLADTATITNSLADKTVEFNNIATVAIGAYDALKVLNKKDVTLASVDDIDALKAWFDTYFGLDITTDDALLADVVLDATHKVDAATVADAKAAIVAFAELTAAKKVEFDALKAEIDALIEKNASTALRADVDSTLANYDAWLNGVNVPEGYEKVQFVPVDVDALAAEKLALDSLNAAVTRREKNYISLQTRIAALELDYTKIEDTVYAQSHLTALNNSIKSFIKINDGVDCFTEEEKAILADAQIAINQAVALADLLAYYETLIASLGDIADTRVVENMTARADAALDAAEEAVKANNDAAIDLAYANFDLFAATIANYKASLAIVAGDATKEAKVYEAYDLLSNREAMANADQLADWVNVVVETFAAVLA